MSRLRRFKRALSRPFRFLASALSDFRHPTAWLREAYGAKKTAGVWVTSETALTLPVYFAIISLISKTVAMLPRSVYRRLEVGREKMADHEISWLLNNPNRLMTAMAFWELIVQWAVSAGSGAAWIERDARGRPVALWPMHPATLDRRLIDGELWYFWTPSRDETGKTGTIVLRPDEVFDLHGLGSDGITGYSLIRVGAQAIGVGLAHQSYTGSFFERGVVGTGVLSHPENLSEQARANLGKSFDEAYGGADGKFKTIVLEEGVTWTRTAIPNDEAQLLETGAFNVLQVCILAGVPPPLIGVLDKVPYANAEQMATQWATYGVHPWALRIEQECDRKLFGPRRGAMYVHHNLDGLLRADFLTRMEGYQKAINSGWLAPDEVREREEMNPIPGGLGGHFFMQGANKTLDQIVNPPEPPEPAGPVPPPIPEDDEEMPEEEMPEEEMDGAVSAAFRLDLLGSHRFAFDAAAAQVVRREEKALQAVRKKYEGNPKGLQAWSAKWQIGMADHIVAAFQPAASGFASAFRAMTGEECEVDVTDVARWWIDGAESRAGAEDDPEVWKRDAATFGLKAWGCAMEATRRTAKCGM